MNETKLEVVLHELLDTQKETNETMKQMAQKISDLKQDFRLFAERKPEIKMEPPAVDTSGIETIITRGVAQIKIAASEPRTITKEYSLVVFPKDKPAEYYNVWFKWLAVIIAIILVFLLCSMWMSLNK